MILRQVPDRYFEAAGTFFGFLASATIAAQIYAEYVSDQPSTVSLPYAAGFLVIFAFWTLYGIRFRRVALWLTNAVAVGVQAVLLVLILMKS